MRQWFSSPAALGVAAALALACAPGTSSAAGPLTLGATPQQLEVSGRVQAGYIQVLEQDEDTGDSGDRFALGQVRLQLRGLVRPGFDYEIAAEFASSSALPATKDAWLGYEPADWLRLQLGQYKVPSSRHRLASDAKLLFISRPDLTDDLVPGRDVGLRADLRSPERSLVFSFGAFTGQGENPRKDDSEGLPLLAGRLAWQPLAKLSSGEGDLERSAALALGLGVYGAWSRSSLPQAASVTAAGLTATSGLGGLAGLVGTAPSPLGAIDGDKTLLGADLTLKWRGLFLSAEATAARFEPKAGDDYLARALLLQAAYAIEGLNLEPAVRFDVLDPSDGTTGDLQPTLTWGLSYFPLQDRLLRVQLNYEQRLERGGDDSEAWDDDRVLLFAQYVFG